MDFVVYQRYCRCWIIFEKDVDGKQECTGYVNFDYAGDLECADHYRVCFYLVTDSSELACNLQSTVALLTTEAEYMALT